jgi:penicillin V acylase-like amidase (Ntn superfamily)
VYPPKDARPVVGGLEWIQYQLDRSGTIQEVMQRASEIRISTMVKLHYLVCDRTGACVTAEFLEGSFTPHWGGSLPIAVLTNDTYQKSLDYLRTLNGFGGNSAPSSDSTSLDRFGRAALMLKNYHSGKSPIAYSFDVLANVAQGPYTKWSIVYDLSNLRVYFRTWASKQIKYLDLGKLDFDCGSRVKVLNINAVEPGDVSRRLRNYTRAINRELVQGSYRETPFLSGVPQSEIELSVRHPETFACVPD